MSPKRGTWKEHGKWVNEKWKMKNEMDVKEMLQFVFTEMKINTLHSPMHASKLSS